MRFIIFVFFLFTTAGLSAQKKDDEDILRHTAQQYLAQGDTENALEVYHQLHQRIPENSSYRRMIAQTYFLQGNWQKAEKEIASLLTEPKADLETYPLACWLYDSLKKNKEACDAINKGIEKFPHAGILYATKGEALTLQGQYEEANKVWEKGIQMEPNYADNYYHLCKAYYTNKRYAKAIYAGEVWINLEPYSTKSEEIKKILFDGYQLLISDLHELAMNGRRNQYDNPKHFEEAVLENLMQSKQVTQGGINTERLLMLRVRFLLAWQRHYAAVYPSALFEYQYQLIRKGYFDAYNQWIFGRRDDEKKYVEWTKRNEEQMSALDNWIRKHPLHIPNHQYPFTQ